MGGVLIGVAAGLLLLLLVTLPPKSRRKLRAPAVFFGLYLFVVLLRFVLPRAHHDKVTWVEVLSVFLLLLVLARGVVLFVAESRVAKRLLPPLPKIFEDILQFVLYVGVALITLRSAGVDTSSLLTTSAILSAVLGFALQDTLGNVFAGLAIQAQRPFEIGDWVEIDGTVGQVLEISWRAMKVLTLDHVEVIVPNGVLAKGTIKNFTKPTVVSRRSLDLSASYEIPPERVQQVALSALEDVPRALTTPAPSVVLSTFGESSVHYTLRYFTDDFGAAVVTDSLVRYRVWYAFKRANIAIPFPQRDVHLFEVSAESRAAEGAMRLAERQAALAYVSFFDALPPDARVDLANRSTRRLYASGETIIRQGDEGDELFVVLRGDVAVVLESGSRDASHVEVARLGHGKFFGEMSLMTGEKRAATVRAVNECQLLVVGHEAFESVLEGHPELAERLSVMLAERQLQLDERQAVATAKNKQALDERSSQILSKIRAFFAIEK